MIGTKQFTEAVGHINIENMSVGERSVLGWSFFEEKYGQNRSENVGLSNENIGENPMLRKSKGSSTRFVHGGLVRT